MDSSVDASVLLQLTNEVLNLGAKSTNQAVTLNKKKMRKSKPVPKPIKKALKTMKKINRKYRQKINSNVCNSSFSQAKKHYRQIVRRHNIQEGIKRDEFLYSVCGTNPTKFFNFLKKSNMKSTEIEKLTVGSKVYLGSHVSDGFYESMSSLKHCSFEDLRKDPALEIKFSTYEHLVKLCQDRHSIPSISVEDSNKILKRMKKNVTDFYSISALHYLNAGPEGLLHFNCLLNAIISDINNASLEELNTALGLILYKGHKKEKTSD